RAATAALDDSLHSPFVASAARPFRARPSYRENRTSSRHARSNGGSRKSRIWSRIRLPADVACLPQSLLHADAVRIADVFAEGGDAGVAGGFVEVDRLRLAHTGFEPKQAGTALAGGGFEGFEKAAGDPAAPIRRCHEH